RPATRRPRPTPVSVTDRVSMSPPRLTVERQVSLTRTALADHRQQIVITNAHQHSSSEQTDAGEHHADDQHRHDEQHGGEQHSPGEHAAPNGHDAPSLDIRDTGSTGLLWGGSLLVLSALVLSATTFWAGSNLSGHLLFSAALIVFAFTGSRETNLVN